MVAFIDCLHILTSAKLHVSGNKLVANFICYYFSDLSGVDMRKVQSLALIELTALFDLKRIELKRRKTGKTKPKGKANSSLTERISVQCYKN